jgi:methionine salvage enolase-phosphatase E1
MLAIDKILFLSDVAEELNAAAEAGMQTYLIVRDGTPLPAGCPHPSAANFHQVIPKLIQLGSM